jgi:hypothetical protein
MISLSIKVVNWVIKPCDNLIGSGILMEPSTVMTLAIILPWLSLYYLTSPQM